MSLTQIMWFMNWWRSVSIAPSKVSLMGSPTADATVCAIDMVKFFPKSRKSLNEKVTSSEGLGGGMVS